MSARQPKITMQKGRPEDGFVHVLIAGKGASGSREELSATVTKSSYCAAMEILIKSMKGKP